MPMFSLFDDEAPEEMIFLKAARNERTATPQMANAHCATIKKQNNIVRSPHGNSSLPTVYETSPKDCHPTHLRRNYAFSTIGELKL
ncbi:hypothetical protein M408DRAFT_328335 [Serendipita vermifera MAFF 305830]|uniref:Uncharacterized protein n=1 Tax=Serendipita vermifera MAFF 305830 TaxID=933852 RepID=A0A0C3B0M6_SERVB|nr:hypothetical protein M408DRAFT_328335 [Serendipita vermifera MAFF 305830]